MRKITLLSILVAMVTFTFAQQAVTPRKNVALKAKQGHISYNHNKAVIWSNDFANAADWVAGTGAGASADTWVIGTGVPSGTYAIPGITSTTAANGFALFDSDVLCSGNQIANLTTATSINCTGHTAVAVTFEEMYRRWYDSTFVFVSTDGTNWTKFQIQPNYGYANNTMTTNPTLCTVNISSAIAGNPATVWIRFQFWSPASSGWGTNAGCGYSWMIDDVQLIDASANDLILGNTFCDFNGSDYYNTIPASQISAITLAGIVSNNGSAAQTNVVLNANYNGTSTISSVAVASFASGSVDTLVVDATTLNTLGAYAVEFNVTQNQTDENPADNVDSVYFNVDSTMFMRGAELNALLNTYAFASPVVPTTGFEYGADYYFPNEGIVSSVIIPVYEAVGTGTVVGKVYSRDLTTGDRTLVAQTDPYTPAGGFEPLWIPLQTAYNVAAGTLLTATVQLNVTVGTDTISILANDGFYGNDQTGAAYINVSGTFDWYYVTGTMPLIGLEVHETVGVKAVANTNSVVLFPNPTTGILNITNADNAKVSVFNMLGQEVLSAYNVKSIDMSNMANGSYFVKVQTNDNVVTKKINLVK